MVEILDRYFYPQLIHRPQGKNTLFFNFKFIIQRYDFIGIILVIHRTSFP
jgi:hypothetical protein